MKESKILKAISYVIIPILIGAILMSIFSIIVKEDTYYNEEKYFSSDLFVRSYMYSFSEPIYNLIHDNLYTKKVQDGDIEIRYSYDDDKGVNVSEQYYLIIYKDIAFTNVKITSSTNI